MVNSNNTSKLRKENDQLKSQLQEISKELNELRSKVNVFDTMATKERGEQDKIVEMDKSLSFLSDGYDDLKDFRASLESDFKRITTKLEMIEESVLKMDETIEAIQKYSYQYNIKILGISQTSRTETAQESTDLCLKLFSLMGIKVTEQDIDIAHRVPNRKSSSSPPTIICKFTRRLAKEAVMRARKELGKIEWDKADKVKIFDHLTPKTQEIFNKAKEFQKDHDFAYCWTRNSSIFLKKEAESSQSIKVTGLDILEKLRENAKKGLGSGEYLASSASQGEKVGQIPPNGEFASAPSGWRRIWPPPEVNPTERPRTRSTTKTHEDS